jgi:predicted metal-binding protein
MPNHRLLVCKSCHRPSEELADAQTPNGSLLLKQLETLCGEQLQGEQVKIEPVECLWACGRGCVVAVSSTEKPTYLFVDILPQEITNNALLELVKIYIKSHKGMIAWKKVPEVLQPSVFAQIPPAATEKKVS